VSNGSEYLLSVLSAKQEMSWAAWKKAFDYLSTTPTAAEPFNVDRLRAERTDVLRALDALGHCDAEFDEHGGGRVFVASPVLARLPLAGLPQAVLAGNRTPQTVQQLVEACRHSGGEVKIEITAQPARLRLLSARVLVRAATVEALAQFAVAQKLQFDPQPAAWRILHFAGTLNEYLATCPAASELNWARRDFALETLQFRPAHTTGTELRLSNYTDRVRNSTRCLLWQQGRARKVERAWGRYAMLQAAGLNVLIYDAPQLRFAVPISAPLPRLLARGLALCSGYAAEFLPRESLPHSHPEQRGFAVFQAVPPPIAELAAEKVGQSLLPYSLNLSCAGAKR
jgi:hypothetical protein